MKELSKVGKLLKLKPHSSIGMEKSHPLTSQQRSTFKIETDDEIIERKRAMGKRRAVNDQFEKSLEDKIEEVREDLQAQLHRLANTVKKFEEKFTELEDYVDSIQANVKKDYSAYYDELNSVEVGNSKTFEFESEKLARNFATSCRSMFNGKDRRKEFSTKYIPDRKGICCIRIK